MATIGQALMEIGRSIPTTMRQRRLDEEERRRNLLSTKSTELGIEAAQKKLADDEVKRNFNADALVEIDKLAKDRQLGNTLGQLDFSKMKTDQLPRQRGTIDDQGVLRRPDTSDIISDLPADQYADTPDINELNKNPLSSATDRLGKYGSSDAGQEYLDRLTKAEEFDIKRAPKSAFNSYGARVNADTQENRDRAKEFIKNNKEKLGIDDQYADFLNGQIDAGYVFDVDKLLRDKGTGGRIDIKNSVDKQTALLPGEIRGAQEKSYVTTTASEQAKRDIQKIYPMLQGDKADEVLNSSQALPYLYELRDALTSGSVEYFDVTKPGQFTNPKIDKAYRNLIEIIGRKNSGAAISASEWTNFGKQVLNKNYLLSQNGKTEAQNQIDALIDKFYQNGFTNTGDENWFATYRDRTQKARKSGESALGREPKETIKSGADSSNTQNGWTDAKAKRLAELRAKKAAGILGR